VEELRLRVFQNSEMEKWEKLYTRSFRIISKLRGMQWTGYAARLKYARNVYSIDVGIILNYILKKYVEKL
jgi:hypothetical protein